MEICKIFISYAKEDVRLMEKVYQKCTELKYFNFHNIRFKVIVECDQNIIPGEKYELELESKIKEADLVIFLVSKAFLSSKYIVEKEIPWASVGKIDSGRGLFGIYLEKCNYNETILGNNLQMIPSKLSKLKPVNEWSNKIECWTFIKESMKVAAKLSISNKPLPLRPMTIKNKSKYLVEKTNR
jgi:TIR domain